MDAARPRDGKIGGSTGVKPLGEVVKDKNADNEVRRKAAEALGKIGADAKSAVSALTDVVKDAKTDREVRNAAVEALGNMGPAAADALPTLKGLNKKQRDKTFLKLLNASIKKIEEK